MRTTRALAALGVAGAFLGLAAPTAGAWDGSTISVDPTVAGRGATVAVNITAHECSGGGTAYSSAFERGSVTLYGKSGGAHGNAKIDHGASFGRHDVTVSCNGAGSVTKSQAVTVIGPAQGGSGGSLTAGATSTDIAIGTGLVTAAVAGGGVFWLRRRGDSRA